MSTTRVLVVDDNSVLRRSIRLVFESELGFEVVGEAGNGREAIDKAKGLKPNLVILDLAMPVMTGLEAAPILKEVAPGVRVILLLTLHGNRSFEAYVGKSVDAVFGKDQPFARLVDAARTLVRK